ncbi:MAG TPA: hypothetical protein VFS56_01915, partial [Gemmatimonadaceae bacterium]|nr:hypothetical protein [Gemmatimonadaceae bacterium]
MTNPASPTFDLGAMPLGAPMQTVDEQLVRAPVKIMFGLASRVEQWPDHLAHYRYVKFRERKPDGGGIVEMAAYRPFDPG